MSAEILPFARRRTYQDAKREQGLAPANDSTPKTALLQQERIADGLKIFHLENSAALTAVKEQIENRFWAICEAYHKAGFGDEQFGFLIHILFHTDLASFETENMFCQVPGASASPPPGVRDRMRLPPPAGGKCPGIPPV